jgi:hypothetical protein
MEKPWKVVLAFIGVFIAGAVFGGVFTLRTAGKRIVDRPGKSAPAADAVAQPKQSPPQSGIAPALMRQFTQNIKLTNAQKEKVRPLVNRAAEDLQRLRRENLENTVRVMERMYTDVAAWLTVEQRGQLDAMRTKMQEKAAEDRKKRGDPPVGEAGGARKSEPGKATTRPGA